MKKGLFQLRRMLLSAGFFAGLILFWLPAHEVFEGPKTFAFLIYSALLAALSLPLFRKWTAYFGASRQFLIPALALLGASILSLAGAALALPANLLLSMEKLAPMAAACLSALVFFLEEKDTQRRVLFSLAASHGLLVVYGLVQVVDQNLGRAMGINFDMIRWTSFGVSRVYSSMGNPDYMAAQLTLFLALWIGLGPRRGELRLAGALQAAAALAALLPLPIVVAVYGFSAPVLSEVMKSYWAWFLVCAACFFLFRSFGSRFSWLAFAYMQVFLIFAAQGRGAYIGLAASILCMAAQTWWRHGRDFWARHRSFMKLNGAALGLGILCFAGLAGLRRADPGHSLLKLTLLQSAFKVSDSLQYRLVHLFDAKSDSTVVRLFYYKSALLMGAKHPLFGVGFGNHAMHTARMQSEVWKGWEKTGNKSIGLVDPHVELYTHNDFIQNFAETGLIGLAAFLWFWWAFVRGAWRLARDPEPWGARSRMGTALLGFAAAFIASALVNFPWRVLASQQTAWLAMALLAVESRPSLPQPQAGRPLPAAAGWAALALAFFLALWPVKWFFASSLFKQGNLGRDAQNWAHGEKYYAKAGQAGLSGTQRVELYLYLGSMYNSLGKPDEAEKWFKKGVEIYPDFIEALYNLGYTEMVRYGQTKAEADRQKSIGYFERVLDINPRYTSALNNLGNLHYSVKDYTKAIANYEMLIRYSPTTIEARYNLGASYLLSGETDKAKVHLAEALKLNPQYAPALQLYQQIRHLPPGSKVNFK